MFTECSCCLSLVVWQERIKDEASMMAQAAERARLASYKSVTEVTAAMQAAEQKINEDFDTEGVKLAADIAAKAALIAPAAASGDFAAVARLGGESAELSKQQESLPQRRADVIAANKKHHNDMASSIAKRIAGPGTVATQPRRQPPKPMAASRSLLERLLRQADQQGENSANPEAPTVTVTAPASSPAPEQDETLGQGSGDPSILVRDAENAAPELEVAAEELVTTHTPAPAIAPAPPTVVPEPVAEPEPDVQPADEPVAVPEPDVQPADEPLAVPLAAAATPEPTTNDLNLASLIAAELAKNS
jgi:hypothetical protein